MALHVTLTDTFTHFIPRLQTRTARIGSKKLQFFSDLHLEYRKTVPHIPVCGDYCAILGDLGNPFRESYSEVLHFAANNYERTFVLAGNHEYWQKDKCILEVNERICKLTSKHSNVEFLDNTLTRLDGHLILGTTLWTNLGEKTKNADGNNILINPIHTATAKDITALHNRSVEWLEACIELYSRNNKVIVLTHHLPSFKLIIEKYQTDRWKGYHKRYATDLEYLMGGNVKYWICGHSHCVTEADINGTLCKINAHGYSSEIDDLKSVREDWIKIEPI